MLSWLIKQDSFSDCSSNEVNPRWSLELQASTAIAGAYYDLPPNTDAIYHQQQDCFFPRSPRVTHGCRKADPDPYPPGKGPVPGKTRRTLIFSRDLKHEEVLKICTYTVHSQTRRSFIAILVYAWALIIHTACTIHIVPPFPMAMPISDLVFISMLLQMLLYGEAFFPIPLVGHFTK